MFNAFGLTLFAGLATAIGGLFVLVKKEMNARFLSLSLGFSGGVMIYISFTEILGKSTELFSEALDSVRYGTLAAAAAFFGGMIFIALIDMLVPEGNNPHEMSHVNLEFHTGSSENHQHKLLKSGMLTAIALGVHNFPEGIATFSMAASDINLGIPIAVAIAIHNIPEGIAVAAPIFQATGSRKRAFVWSFFSGLAEPVGGLIGFVLLQTFLTPTVLGVLFGMVAGIMVFISLDELLPLAHEYGEEHTSIWGIVAGMAVIAVSLILFM